jgi:hypothetical protein
LHQILEKVITRKRYLSRGTAFLKEKCSRLRAQVKKAIKESRELFFQSLGSTLKINPKRSWSIFKIKSSSGSVPNLVSRICTNNPESRSQASTPHNIASIFNEYFHSVYTSVLEQPSSTQPSSFSSISTISSIDLTQEEVCHALQKLDTSKAHGPDGLPSHILKECAHQLAPSLHYLFTKSLHYLFTKSLCLETTHSNLFADDIILSCQGHLSTDIEHKLNKDLENAQKWLSANKLTLNNEKTKYMIIGSRQQLKNLDLSKNEYKRTSN